LRDAEVSDPAAYVYLDLAGVPRLVGRLWVAASRERAENATFKYDTSWLISRERFAIEPALTLDPAPFHAGAGAPLFGAIGDSAPDRWGRTLIARAERHRASAAATSPRSLREIDYLLGVTDEVRQGALRFSRTEGGEFVAQSHPDAVPPLLTLGALLGASDRVIENAESSDDLKLLLAEGSSLGGARPKASVRDRDGGLLIAKFPARVDDVDVVRWEAVALDLARRAGVDVPNARLELVMGRAVLLIRRFDRDGAVRIPFLSAMSMLGAVDRERRSYLEIADVLRQHGAATADDLSRLWRRMVFNVLISNTDDHLRNHGFLYTGLAGWRLSPAYDLNPVPTDVRPRELATTINLDDPTASLSLALGVAADFGLKATPAAHIARFVADAVGQWRDVAAEHGVSGSEINRMASAFEHQDLTAALRLPQR
jgi:serine/threonine-protein kinase HipA